MSPQSPSIMLLLALFLSSAVQTVAAAACFSDLTQISVLESEFALDTSVHRTYILCPGTLFDGSNIDSVFIVRPNVIYKCGDNGDSADHCVVTGGVFHMLSLASPLGIMEIHSNVTFKGITFEDASQGSLLFANKGDYLFEDCIFRNHINPAVVLSIVDDVFFVRRRDLLGKELTADLTRRLNREANSKRTQERLGQRRRTFFPGGGPLGLPPAATGPLVTVTFKTCLFMNNVALPTGGVNREGIVTAESARNAFVFENSLFLGNEYGANEIGYAIETRSDITIKDTCFIGNDFQGNGVVLIATEDDPMIKLNRNFGKKSRKDDDLLCEFAATKESSDDDIECVPYDSDECQSSIWERFEKGGKKSAKKRKKDKISKKAKKSQKGMVKLVGNRTKMWCRRLVDKVFDAFTVAIHY